MGITAKPCDQEVLQLLLLALQPVGMGGVTFENAQVEYGPLTGFLQPHLPARRDEPLRRQLRSEAECIEHVEGGRMESRGAQILRNLLVSLEHDDRHIRCREAQGSRQSDRSAADNQHWLHAHASRAPQPP